MKSRYRILSAVVFAILILAASMSVKNAQSATASTKRLLVKIEMSEFKAHYAEIRQAGLDIAGMNIPNGKVDLIVNPDEYDLLRRMGITLSRNPMEILQSRPDTKFKTPDQVAQILIQLQHAFPALSQVASIGKSLQGRDIVALRITQNVDQADGSKPALLFNGMHHAREVMSTEVPLDIAEYLLFNYGKDAKVTHWVNSNVIYVIPMLNVDGNNIVWTQDSMWRKNARAVDINRNYPFQWDSCNGSGSNTNDQDYHGPSPASEPETNVLMHFVKVIHPVFDISFHSYSELVIYPYGCGNHTETADVVEPLGKQMAALIPSDSGNGHYTAGLAPELLYSVDGDDIDWMYHEGHVIPFVIELNSDARGFQPGYDQWRDRTVASIRPAWQLLLDRLDGSSIHGNILGSSQALNAAYSGSIEVRSVHADAPFLQTYPVRGDGSFHMILNPGDYRLKYGSLERTVHVGSNRLNMNIDLSNP